MIQLSINCIFMGLITCFMFEAQINYMWFQKKFKVYEILHVTNFYVICSPNFSLKCLHHSVLSLPKSIHLGTYYLVTPPWNDSIVEEKFKCRISVPRRWKMLSKCYQNEDKSILANNHQTIGRAKVAIEETNCKKILWEFCVLH